MKTYGIICEYNPFHNGHIRQIEETRKAGATHIAAFMSGNFVQRGDVAIIDKFKRAEIAVKNGVDLVVEIPVQYSLSNAEYFARSGIMMMASLRCVDGISFGSECGDLEQLQKCADAVREVAVPENLKPMLEQGMSYPEAVSQLVAYKFGPAVSEILDKPNNTLAIEYLKAIKALGLEDKLTPLTIKREGAEHDSDAPSGNIASASYIRTLIDDEEDFSAYVPKETLEAINDYDVKHLLSWFDNLERPILYRLRTMSPQELATIPDVGQGLENRIFEAARVSSSLEQLIANIGTRRYPTARIRRILLNALCAVRTDDLKVPPVCGRILALNDRGAEILRMAGSLPEDKFAIPFSSAMKDFAASENKFIKRSVGLTTYSSDIYTLASRAIRPCGMDFTAPITFDKIPGFVSELPEELETKAYVGPRENAPVPAAAASSDNAGNKEEKLEEIAPDAGDAASEE